MNHMLQGSSPVFSCDKDCICYKTIETSYDHMFSGTPSGLSQQVLRNGVNQITSLRARGHKRFKVTLANKLADRIIPRCIRLGVIILVSTFSLRPSQFEGSARSSI